MPVADTDREATPDLERKLATILSADVAGYSRLMAEDEEHTLRTFRGHKEVFEKLVELHRGRIFNTAGDAILAEFGSAVEAVRCATDIQAALRTRNDQLPPSRQVRFRMGINLGDVMLHGQDLLGDGVNVAARLQTAAEPGGICISGSVHDQISNKLSLSFQSLGEMNFKNIQQPIRTFSITDVENQGTLPSRKPRGTGSHWAKWIAVALLLGAGGYAAYIANNRMRADRAGAIQPTQPVARVEPPPARAPEAKATDAPREPAGAPAARLRRYDGVYTGPICYGKTPKEPERCYQAEGTISGGKIAGQWKMGREKKVNMLLAGDVSRSGDVKIEIEMEGLADGSRLATINLTGTLRGGLLNAAGSFRKG